MTPLMIFGATMLPALLATLVCAIALRVWVKNSMDESGVAQSASGSIRGMGQWGGRIGASLAMAVVVSVCFVQESFLPAPRVNMSIEWWVAYFSVACMVVAPVVGMLRIKPVWGEIGRAALCLAASSVVVTPLMRSEYFSSAQGIAWIVGMGIWMWAVVWAITRTGIRLPGCGSTAMVHILAGVASPVVLLWNNQTFSKMLGAIAGATFFIGVLTLWKSRRAIHTGVARGVGVWGGVLTCMLAGAGYLYGYPGGPGGGSVAGVWLGGAFLGVLIGELPGIRKTKPWVRLSIQMIAVTIIGGVALGYALVFGDINELLKLIGLELDSGHGY